MGILALDLDDRGTSLARDGEVLVSLPSAVFDGSVGGVAGENAWGQLRLHPRATSTRHLNAVLTQRNSSARAETLVEAQLRACLVAAPVGEGERIWIVTPARAEVAGLSALLGITRRMEFPIGGYIDSATVTTAALAADRNAIVLELGLHHASATAVDCEGARARRRAAVSTDRGGLIELYQAWLDLISTTMVKRMRFDPLHHASTEQQLFDALPSLALEAALTGNASAAVTQVGPRGTAQFEITLSRDQLARAAEPLYRSIVGMVHQLRPAGAPVAIVTPGAVSQLPGLREQLEQFVGCEWVGVPAGFAAAATSLLDPPGPPTGDDSVCLIRQVPMTAEPFMGGSVMREPLGQRRADGPPPSHVLLDGRAYSLNAESLVVGRDSATHVVLPEGLAGVSRRHCTFLHDDGHVVLLDHSTFGTLVNGERVQERVRIHAGDRVRLGDPGVELDLIAVGDEGSALPSNGRLTGAHQPPSDGELTDGP